MRVIVCRGTSGNAVATNIICFVFKKHLALDDNNSLPQSLETTMIQFGLRECTSDMEQSLKKSSEDFLQIIIDGERVHNKNNAESNAQTDMIGEFCCTLLWTCQEFVTI